MTGFGTWTGEAPDPGTDGSGPGLTAAAASWLPAPVQRAQAIEAQAEAKLARAEKRDREERAERAHDDAVSAYVAGAAMRGEVVSAMDLAAGNVGRTLAEVLSGATGELADRIPVHERGERDYELLDAGEPVLRSGRRYDDGWPSSSYEADSMLRRAADLHTDLVMVQARQASRQGRSAEHLEAERAKANRHHGGDSGTDIIMRYVPTPACDGCGHVRCQCR